MHLESNWRSARTSQDGKSLDAVIKQSWLNFEDRIGVLMESLRSEFRKRQPSSGNAIMKWLAQTPAAQDPPPGATPR